MARAVRSRGEGAEQGEEENAGGGRGTARRSGGDVAGQVVRGREGKPARLGEEVRPAGMVAWLREESAAKQQRAEGKKQQPRKGDRTASERERASILRLRERGLAIGAIAAKLGLPYMAVREVVVVEGRGHH